MIEQTGRIVQRIAVEMAHTHNDLDRVAQGMAGCGHVCDHEAERSPQYLAMYELAGYVRVWEFSRWAVS